MTLGSFGCTLGSLGSFGVVGFSRLPPGGRWVHLKSLGSFVCALRLVGCIRGRCFDSDARWGSLGSVAFRCGLGVVEFIQVRPGHRWVHSVSLGLFGLQPVGRWVYSVSLGSFGCNTGVIRFIKVCPGG